MKLTPGQTIGLVAAILVLLCFFFPWIELDLWLASTNLSGFQLATGKGPGGASFPSVPSLLLVPLSMIGVLVLGAACLVGQNPAGQLKRIASFLVIAARRRQHSGDFVSVLQSQRGTEPERARHDHSEDVQLLVRRTRVVAWKRSRRRRRKLMRLSLTASVSSTPEGQDDERARDKNIERRNLC